MRDKLGRYVKGHCSSPATQYKKGYKRKKEETPWYGKKHSEEAKRKMSLAKKGKRTGKNSHSWRGGTSFLPYSVDWTKTLKRAIRERDKYICQMCSQYGDSVHHINYEKKDCRPDNLITLCHTCHSKTNFNRKYWSIILKSLGE